jgi:hypothetical protein
MTLDAVVGGVPTSPRAAVVRVSSARQAQELLGRLDASLAVSAVVVTVVNLFVNGASRVLVAATPASPTGPQLEAAIASLARERGVATVTCPDLLTQDAVEAAARANAAGSWASQDGTLGEPPALLVHVDRATIPGASALGAIPVVPNVVSQPPGLARAQTFAGATLAAACLRAGAGVIRGAHTLAEMPSADVAVLRDAGAAVLVNVRRGIRPSIALELPDGVSVPVSAAPSAEDTSLEARLQAIVDDELAQNPFGDVNARIVRELTAALHEAVRAGELDEASGRPFMVAEGDDGAIEVLIRRPARKPRKLDLRLSKLR